MPLEDRHYSVHGLPVRLEMDCQPFEGELDRMLSVFSQTRSDPSAAVGIIRPFDPIEVARSVSPAAQPVGGVDDLTELYSQDERYWLVDDRWGMCEVNLLKRQWRSWILPSPTLDPVRLIEAAVLWPMSHLLRMKGIDLVPAISVENNGWGALIIAPYGIGPEIACLLRSGYRVIGQQWTGLRAIGRRVALLGFPGVVQMPGNAAIRISLLPERANWHDLAAEYPAHTAQRGWCEAVFVVAPGRRSITRGREDRPAAAMQLLRHAWPIIELPVSRRRIGDAASILANHCPCVSVELSRRGDDFVRLMESVRLRRPAPKVEVKVNPGVKRGPVRQVIATRS